MIGRLLWIIVIVVLVGFGVLVVGSHFFTDLMWFQALGYSELLVNRLSWEWGVRIVAWLGLTALLFVNLMITKPVIGQALWRIPQVSQYVKPKHLTWVMAGVSILLGLMYSSGFGRFFWEVAQFFNAQTFQVVDPIFGMDIGFFFFQLPFYRLLGSAVMGALILTLMICTGIYFGAGSFLIKGFGLEVSKRAQGHLSALAGLFVLARALSYQLDRFELVYSPVGAVFGAGYTDITIRLVVLQILTVVALVVSFLLLAQLYKYRKLMLGSLALWVFTSVVLGAIVPGLVQQWLVEPNEFAREELYIEHHVTMTRLAYNIDNFIEREFTGTAQLTWDDIQAAQHTIDNIRLWDPRALLQTYGQLQSMRLYYQFIDADIGRYWIDGEYRQVLVSARELAVDQIQNRTWINEHLQYTHGYGAVVSPVNQVTRQGLPDFWISDIPPRSTVSLQVTQPGIYYGERTEQYVIVNAKTEEFDFPRGDSNAYTTYQGTGGVVLSSPLHRLAFALRYATTRILLATDITTESRILFDRNINERVRKIAPFLRYDADPYLVISEDGRLFWMIDAYTISNRFPYSLPVRGWGNYVRNSVKVVIDAYNGSVDFYQVDEDPLLETYSAIFPGWLKPLEEMPLDLRAHIRYPEDFLALQARLFGTYHMTDRRVFYNREDVWTFANEVYAEREQEVVPYYVMMELPEEEGPEMVLMLPFTPARRNNLVAWLAARNDGENYGEVMVYRFPKESLTLGPSQIEARIDQDSDISQLLTLWGQRGSQVIRGNLLVLPVGEGLIYVEPLYLQSEQSSMPQLQRVIVAHQDDIVMAETLELALQQLFGVRPVVPQLLDESDLEPLTPPASFFGEGGNEAYELYQDAQEALRVGDFAAFGRAWEQLEEILIKLIRE